jgi:formate C-acetyltransferase
MMLMMLHNKLLIEGNLNYPLLLGYYISLFTGVPKKPKRPKIEGGADSTLIRELATRKQELLTCDQREPGVKYLPEPYLSQYRLEDFPRVAAFLDLHFTVKPEICAERPKILTDWFKANGFETTTDGKPWIPELRQGQAFKYLMENRKPIIRNNDLIAGTTTGKEIGVVVYPDSSGTTIWSELNTVDQRELNSYFVSEETKRILHREVFPYWIKNRSFREWVRERYQNPVSQQLDERFAVYFLWKTVALSHTIPDFPKILSRGTKAIIAEIQTTIQAEPAADEHTLRTRQAMILCLEGLTAYAKNLSRQAKLDAEAETDPIRKLELLRLADICHKVPELPCQSLDEAVNSLWITWIGMHMENTNAGLSLGRLDQWLQPYFEMDLARIQSEPGRQDYIKRAIELIGCFYLRCTDHLPLVADIGNYLFGGSSSDQAITLGGQKPDGSDAVCDMTYIFLKVTEMLSLRDPNVNARYTPGVNSDAYLKRLCEVNLITAATPSLHNDKAVMASLEEFNYEIEDLRDWSATGCVEPTLSGKHLSHTNCMMMNMVAALEMALNNGTHPLMKWKVGPATGEIAADDFKDFESFYRAFLEQFKFLIDQSIQLNNLLGEAHTQIRPTPFLSSLIDGCIAKGKDVTWGGSKYNSSGAACIGLADVTDSLMAIKTLVFDEKRITFTQLKAAIDANYGNDPMLHELILKKVPRFGSGSTEALALANRITKFTHDYYGSHTNFRGGKYTAGFWSMSNHVAFGSLSGALPSGKLAGKAFTPGLTPSPIASKNLLDNIRDVARLDPKNLNNNIAFNVKVVPSAHDSHQKTVENIFSYVKTYFDLGGMQMQLNVVTSAMLRDAMAHPEEYRNLIVRISGYNAYFVTLNRDLQIELIERAEYGI